MPQPAYPASPVEKALREAVARFDALALGTALGLTVGLLLWAATTLLVLKGGDPVGPTLSLLGHYFPGYRVTLGGSLIGLAYGGAAGFAIGWSMAAVYNGLTTFWLYLMRLKANLARLTDFLDPDHVS